MALWPCKEKQTAFREGTLHQAVLQCRGLLSGSYTPHPWSKTGSSCQDNSRTALGSSARGCSVRSARAKDQFDALNGPAVFLFVCSSCETLTRLAQWRTRAGCAVLRPWQLCKLLQTTHNPFLPPVDCAWPERSLVNATLVSPMPTQLGSPTPEKPAITNHTCTSHRPWTVSALLQLSILHCWLWSPQLQTKRQRNQRPSTSEELEQLKQLLLLLFSKNPNDICLLHHTRASTQTSMNTIALLLKLCPCWWSCCTLFSQAQPLHRPGNSSQSLPLLRNGSKAIRTACIMSYALYAARHCPWYTKSMVKLAGISCLAAVVCV